MRFVNNGPHRSIRIGDTEDCKWVGLNKGQEIDLPEWKGIILGLDRVTEGKIGKTRVETKQFEDFSKIKVPEFEKELMNIKGIGAKIAWDISKVFPTRNKLIKSIKSKEHIPFKDDVVKKLKRKYVK